MAVFDPVTAEWRHAMGPRVLRRNHVCKVYDGKLWVIGGGHDVEDVFGGLGKESVEIFDPGSKGWSMPIHLSEQEWSALSLVNTADAIPYNTASASMLTERVEEPSQRWLRLQI